MTRFGRSSLFALFVLVPALAVAQVRTFVSTTGVDNANCGRIDPCRTFNAAIAAVQAGGEVVVLDSGGYGPTTVNKSVALIAPSGLHAAIAPTVGSAGVLVNAGSTDKVILRNLSITLLGGAHGVSGLGFGRLFVEDCTISNAGGHGIVAFPAANGELFVSDCEIRGSSGDGVRIQTSSGKIFAAVSRTRAHANENGFHAAINSAMACTDCEAYANAASGFVADGGSAVGETDLWCDRCVSSRNLTGFYAIGNEPAIAWIALARSAAYGNVDAGLREFDGGRIQVLTGTTALFQNGTDKVGAIGALTADTP